MITEFKSYPEKHVYIHVTMINFATLYGSCSPFDSNDCVSLV